MKKTNRLFLLLFTAIFSISSTVNAQQGSATTSFAAYEQSYHKELMDHYSSEVRAKMNQIIAIHKSDPIYVGNLDLLANDISSLNENERYVAMILLIGDYEFNLKNNPGTYTLGTGFALGAGAGLATFIHTTFGKETVSNIWIWEDRIID